MYVNVVIVALARTWTCRTVWMHFSLSLINSNIFHRKSCFIVCLLEKKYSSMKIIPHALQNYMVNNFSVASTLLSPYSYCAE